MRKRVGVIISVLLVLSFAGTSYAVEKRKINFVNGVVKSFDAKTGAITVKANGKPDFTYFIDSKTVLRMSNGRKTADQIKVGDMAAAVYQEVQGKPVATSITVLTLQAPPSAAKTNPAVEKGKNNLVSGVVKSFDPKTGAVTVKTNGKPDFTCFIDSKTELRMNNGRKTADQIKVGDMAAVACQEVQGKPVATTISVMAPQGSLSAEKKVGPANSQEKK